MLTPSFHSPCGRSSRGTWNTYAASPKALPTKSTATSDTPSTPGASQPACALECEEPLCPYGECGRRWPLTMREATTGARRQRRTRVLAPALAVRTAVGSRSAVLDVSMVCHALARVSVAAMSAMMRLGSSVFVRRLHTVVAQHLYTYFTTFRMACATFSWVSASTIRWKVVGKRQTGQRSGRRWRPLCSQRKVP